MTVILHEPRTPLPIARPVVLAIGSFDGVHRGHQALLSHLEEMARALSTKTALITYDNHPTEFLRPNETPHPIYSCQEKIALLQATIKLDYLLLFHFDATFASQTPEEFLVRLMELIPFSYLNMGCDGKLGCRGQGSRPELERLAKKIGFTLEYMPQLSIGSQRISSSEIRKLIRSGELKRVAEFLGRPYSVAIQVENENCHSQLKLSTQSSILPPTGCYPVLIKTASLSFETEAFIDPHSSSQVTLLQSQPTTLPPSTKANLFFLTS